MNSYIKFFSQVTLLVLYYLSIASNCFAEIVPAENSINSITVKKKNNTTNILIKKDFNKNTFSIFEKFNIPLDSLVKISSGDHIKNNFIFIKDKIPSNIYGTLSSENRANLYLINRAGFNFGHKSNIDIQGSLFLMTADQYEFSGNDINFFEDSNLNKEELLRIDPKILRIKFTKNPGKINFLAKKGISVYGDNSIGFFGGSLIIKNGGIFSNNGNIYLSANAKGSNLNLVSGSPKNSLFDLQAPLKEDILIDDLAVVQTQGNGAGSIFLEAQNITIKNGGRIQSLNTDQRNGGVISIRALESVNLYGNTNIDSPIDQRYLLSGLIVPQKTSILSFSFSSGSSSNIDIITKDLNITDGADITTATQGFGRGGNIDLSVSRNFILEGELPLIDTIEERIPFDEPISRQRNIDASLVSQVIALSALRNEGGRGGDINIETGSLKLLNGPQITSGSNRGQGGRLSITAKNDILLSGSTTRGFASSTLTTASTANKDASDIIIKASKLTLENGGLIASAALQSGNAGKIDIESEIVEIKGVDKNRRFPSQLNSGTFGSGDSGDILVKAKLINLDDGASISLNSTSTGKTGSLKLNTSFLILENSSIIESNAELSQAGNINISSDIITMYNESKIRTNSSRVFSAGNITIDGKILLGFPRNGNNDITANADNGTGGIIQLTTIPLGFELQSGDKLRSQNTSPDILNSNDITAFSRSNPSLDQGQIIINSSNPGNKIALLPENFVETKNLVEEHCTISENNEFSSFHLVNQTPSNSFNYFLHNNIRTNHWIESPSTASKHNFKSSSLDSKNSLNASIEEASQWVMSQDSQIILVAPTKYMPNSSC